LDAGYGTALRIAAAVTALGGVAAAVAVRETSPVRPVRQPAVVHGCLDPCLEEPARGAAVSR
ncbi:MAG TPA: hypothetical protein VM618_04640, partial [Acidimicrobiia bacterium]|nr:hypothetical protein [Acidimicrobiia bacterium]